MSAISRRKLRSQNEGRCQHVCVCLNSCSIVRFAMACHTPKYGLPLMYLIVMWCIPYIQCCRHIQIHRPCCTRTLAASQLDVDRRCERCGRQHADRGPTCVHIVMCSPPCVYIPCELVKIAYCYFHYRNITYVTTTTTLRDGYYNK